jgi:hypothetical protein
MKNLYFRGNVMTKKIIGVFVCIFVFSSTIIPVASITERHDIITSSYDAEVPIWQIGDEWTYHYVESRNMIPAYYLTGDLTYKVVDDSGDSYVMEATTRPRGAFDLGNIGLKTTMFSRLKMKLQVRKADLGLEKFVEELKGIWKFTIGNITLPIPIQILGRYNVEFDPTWAIMPFPLFDGKYGNLSIVEILHINDTLHLFWGLILAYGPINDAIPIGPIPYTCSEEEVIVEAGTFDTYNISAVWMEGSRFVSYYSEEVGNVVKIVINILLYNNKSTYSNIIELKNWSYSP